MANKSVLGAIGRALSKSVSNTVNTVKKKASSSSTSAYKNTTPVKTYSDEVPIINPSGSAVGSYSEQRADSKNGTAWIPGVGEVPISIINGKVQETGLPSGTIVNTAGGQYQINGANTGGYTAQQYTGTYVPTPQVVNNGGGNIKSNSVQQPSSDVNSATQQNDDYLQQMQDMYNKQIADFQNGLKMQEEGRLKLDNENKIKLQNQTGYQNRNKNRMNNVVGSSVGDVGYGQPQNTVSSITPALQGAHIKQNNGTTSAISRYLATDMWKNK